MRILWVASQLEGRGGIGRVLAQGAQALAARGHELHVAGPAAAEDLAPFAGVALHPWRRRNAKLARLLDLVPLLRRLRPEVVHFHAAAPHAASIAIVRALRGSFGRPLLVATPHGSRARPPRRARRGARAPDLVIAPSRWAAERAAAAGAHHVEVVPGGVTLGPPPALDGRDCAVLAMGRLEASKNLGVLIDAFATAGASLAAWQLWIAGEGPEREALAARAQRSGCGDRVRLLGWIDGAEKARVLARASIGVLPSQRESFGGALLEMQERGLACVASDVGGVADLADGGAAACLVPAGDTTALAAAIARLAADATLRRTLAASGRRHAEGFAWDTVARRYEDAYRAALHQLRRPPTAFRSPP